MITMPMYLHIYETEYICIFIRNSILYTGVHMVLATIVKK